MSSLKAIDDSTYLCTCELRKFPESANTTTSVCTFRNWGKTTIKIKKTDIEDKEGMNMPILLCDILAKQRKE